ncbi:BQ5605_C022g09486 [Microbotryum silenes-dioicae]|uniref:BQ5605_C022g09486 protein n=1 Tax=Microbotryum silenes-dioicae TaxID=796604 RepID=A0A2X0PL95_9BASI|nr:BQ5605_C022g09486 [Microbotryum silenes-dioicae]
MICSADPEPDLPRHTHHPTLLAKTTASAATATVTPTTSRRVRARSNSSSSSGSALGPAPSRAALGANDNGDGQNGDEGDDYASRPTKRTRLEPSSGSTTTTTMPQLIEDLVSNGHSATTNGNGLSNGSGPSSSSSSLSLSLSSAAAAAVAAISSTSAGSAEPHDTAAALAITAGGSSSSSASPDHHRDASDYEHSSFKPLWPGSDIDRREWVRLALQTFKEMGYAGTAQALTRESGFELEIDDVTTFRNGVLQGQWDLVEAMLVQLPAHQVKDHTTVRFKIRQQKFLEALEAKETKKALFTLRNELAPLGHDSDRLHFLSSLIMCASAEDLRARSSWDGVHGESRKNLLLQLQDYISPDLMIPQRRLETLFEQAKIHQQRQCVFHIHNDSFTSLLADCKCDPHAFPSTTTHILHEHTDEIWRLEFSHSGEYLATAGRDRLAVIWKVSTGFTLDKVLREHSDPVSCIAWSPDDTILLTAAESVIKMWNTEKGHCIATLNQHAYQIGALAWFPDGKGFASGGMDSKIYFWDLAGNITESLQNSPSRVIDLAITPDGSRLVAVGRVDTSPSVLASRDQSRTQSGADTPAQLASNLRVPIEPKHDNRISIYTLADRKLEFESTQPHELTSANISDDSRFAIIGHAPDEILYLDLRDCTVVRRYQGHNQGTFVLQACFGGPLQNLILSGSDKGEIYVWHRDTGVLIKQLTGHSVEGSVNAVSWNPKNPTMFASASDDNTVRIWGVRAGPTPNPIVVSGNDSKRSA